jgi:hypothetical protein
VGDGSADKGDALSVYPDGCVGVNCGIFDAPPAERARSRWPCGRSGTAYDPDSTEFSLMPKNEWVHLVWTFDGRNARLDLNGTDEIGPKPLKIGPNVAAPVLLGMDYDGGRVVHGMLDEVRVHGKALTADEVAAICPPSRLARDPSPSDGMVGGVAPLSRCKAGYKAVLHEVYMGTIPDLGPDDLAQARSASLLHYHLQPLLPGTKYYWRVDEIEADLMTVHAGVVWSFVTQALTAYLPDPPDGSTDAAPAPTLTWWPGQAAIGHHVFFGTDPDAVAQGTAQTDMGSVTEATFTPAPLEVLTRYCWRVDETVATGELRAGPVWSFTTHLPIDDFESYNDAENAGTRIYETWIDGCADGSSGSMVGNLNPPFAEQTIVHRGLHSMPLDYNNVNAPYYSEAGRTWAHAQDWTTGDVAFLVLNVQGLPTNQSARLYVAVEDTLGRTGRIVYPDVYAFRTAQWLEWKIALSSFSDAGVTLTAVKELYIGVGDRNAAALGGKGRVYVDDIRLTKP